MADANIRIRLDDKDFRRGLASMRQDLQRTADAAGGVGFSARGIGSMSLGRLASLGGAGLGGYAVGRNVVSGIGAAGQGLTEGLAAALEQAVFGTGGASQIRGDLNALKQVQSIAALSVGMGADPGSFEGLFRVLAEREGAVAKGNLLLQERFGGDIAERTLDLLVSRFGELLDALGDKIVQAIVDIF